MNSFKDFGIKIQHQHFTGDKIKISKILNREIAVIDFKIEDSKYGGAGAKCLYMQIAIGETRHVVFTASKNLIDQIQEVPKTGFPFRTIIEKENECYAFT